MKALVTGGGGFLGGTIVRQLRERGDSVRSFARGDYPALHKMGVEAIRGDLVDAEAVHRAIDGVDVVFHVAALAGVWGPVAHFERVNVSGTRNVIDGCRAAGVDRLVFTSTPSVVYGDAGIEGGDESLPYPSNFLAAYPRTKAQAEQLVLAAHGEDLRTTALRPHLMIGVGDPHLAPRLVARARQGRLKRIGLDPCKVDWTHVDDAARAHLLAADRLASDGAPGGNAYFITQGAPLPVWELVNRILAAAGVAPVEAVISERLAYVVGSVCEFAYGMLGRRTEPPMTRFVAKQLSTPHWFDISAARRDLGYDPQTTLDDVLALLGPWLKEERAS